MSKTQIPSKDQLPDDLQQLYDTLYEKIEGMVAGDAKIDLRSDPNTLRVLIETTMSTVENYKNEDGTGWSGPEKKRYALTLIKLVIRDLARNGRISEDVAIVLIEDLDFWGGVVMDVAIDAIKRVFDVGQTFINDAQNEGIGTACKQNCCCIIS